MRSDWKGGVQAKSKEREVDNLGEETEKGKLFIVQDSGGVFINQAPHGAIIWGNPAADVGSICGRGRT